MSKERQRQRDIDWNEVAVLEPEPERPRSLRAGDRVEAKFGSFTLVGRSGGRVLLLDDNGDRWVVGTYRFTERFV